MKKYRRIVEAGFVLALTVSMTWGCLLAENLSKQDGTKEYLPQEVLEHYQLVWSDEFDGTKLDESNWNYDIGGGDILWGNHELQNYTDRPENISVKNGCLIITALEEEKDGFSYTSGRIQSKEKQSFEYGYIEARIKLTNEKGVLPAFWMLGNDADWTVKDGSDYMSVAEIDIMEHIYNEALVYGTIHWSNGDTSKVHSISSADEEIAFPKGFDASDWHVYAVKWTQDDIIWYVDGEPYMTVNINESEMEEFRKPCYLLLNLAVGGDWPGSPDKSTRFPNSMYVDYVRVYQNIWDIRIGDLRETVFALVSSAENSSLDYLNQYSYIEDIGDDRGYTAGIIGFTTGTGDLLDVVNNYVKRKPTDNYLGKYLPALEKVNGSDSHEGLGDEFIKDWRQAAKDPEMIDAQNDILNEMYLTPAVETAQEDGLSPLGEYIYYDAIVVHGPGEDEDSFGGIRRKTQRLCNPPGKGGNEKEYLQAFLNVRATIMKKEEAHSDLSRLEVQESFLEDGNYNLSLPLEWNMYGDEFRLDY